MPTDNPIPESDIQQLQDFVAQNVSDNDKAIIDKISSMQNEINMDEIVSKYKNAEASNDANVMRLLNVENSKKRAEIDDLISRLSPGVRNLFKLSIIDFKKEVKEKLPNMNIPSALL